MWSDDQPGIYRKICKGTCGVRTKRVGVLIGNQELIGAAQTHRVNDPIGFIKFLAVIMFMTVKNEYLTYKDISKGTHDDENNVCL